MRTGSWLAGLPLLCLISAKVIPIPRSRLLKGREYWIDVTLPGSPTSTLTSTSSGTTTISTSASATITQPGSPYQYIDPNDYNAGDYADDVLLFMQDELYTLSPGTGIEFDCPDNYFTMYFDESVAINGTLQEWGETFESGVMIIPNDWTSYCGDISDWTLYGYSDPDVVFDNTDEETEYYNNIRDPDVQYVVVVLDTLVEVNWLNRTITFEAYADDFRAIIGALNTAPEEYDYFTPGPIGNSTEGEIDFFDTSVKRRDLSSVHSLSKRAGAADLIKVIKILPTLARPTVEIVRDYITIVNQGLRLSRIYDIQHGSLEKQFTNPDVSFDLDFSRLSNYAGWEGFNYHLYQFFYEGQYWVELWRTRIEGGNNNNNGGSSSTPPPTSIPHSTTTTTTTTTTGGTATPPSCSWRPDKEPLNKESGTWWKKLFKIDAEKLITTGDVGYPFKLLDVPGIVRTGKEAQDAISSAQQVLKRFTILSSTMTGTSTSTSSLTITSSNVATTSSSGGTVATSTTGAPAVATTQAIQDLTARQDSDTSLYDNCYVEILDWDIQFIFGNTSATVFPPTLSFHNYALKNRASISLTCKERFLETREVSAFRIAAVPIGGCATQRGELEIDAFFVLFLSSALSSGSNGSITIDYSYTWDPINIDLELLGGGPNDTIQLDAAKLGIGPPSTSGLHFDYLRATTSFPNIEYGLTLSPGIQIDVITPLLNYTRGLMLGPAVNVLSNGTFSVGYRSRDSGSGSGSSSSSSSSLAATSTSSADQSESTDPITDGSDFVNSPDVVNLAPANPATTTAAGGGIFDGSSLDVLTGLSWGVLWTDYTYQKLGGPLDTIFKLPAKRVKVGWLYGPFKFWSRGPD